MTKSITIELQDWANWVAQDEDGEIYEYDKEPIPFESFGSFNALSDDDLIKCVFGGYRSNPDWQNSKINLNTHSAYIDAEGVLHKCELIPEMLKPQAD